MPEATRPIAMIPSDCFRWQPRVQFIDSFRTREAALNCAFEHGYNLIVERSEGKSAQFDVLDDPEGACTSDLELELLKTEEVIVDPYTEGWTTLMLLTIWGIIRRFTSAVKGLCVRQVAPRLRRAVSKRTRAAVGRVIRRAWKRITGHSGFDVRGTYQPSFIPASCKAKTFSLSTARIQTRRIAARSIACYHQDIVPFCQSFASRCWWSSPTVALRRAWHRYSQGSLIDTARRLAAETSLQYTRKVAPRLSRALTRYHQADIKGACRRAWSTTILTAIRFLDRFAAAVAAFYVRQVAPRMSQAAARYQEADFEGTFRRSMEVVAPPTQSNSSQLG